MIDLTDVSFCILGPKKSGKSTLADYLLTQSGNNALYYDTLGEAPHSAIYDFTVPRDRYSVAELENAIRQITPTDKVTNFTPPYRLFIIDEAPRFCPPKPHPLPPTIADLNDQNRHYHMSVGYIARRPVQLNTDLIELADYLFIFRLTGNNDIKYLNGLAGGLGDTVEKLETHHFVIVFPDKTYQISLPITPNSEWIARANAERSRIANRP